MENFVEKFHSVGESGSLDIHFVGEERLAAMEPAIEERHSPSLLDDGVNVLRATRGWIQYGLVGFAILCIVVGAVEALFGR